MMLTALTAAALLVTAQTPTTVEEDLRDDLPKEELARPSDEWGRGSTGTLPAARAVAMQLPRVRLGFGSAALFGVQPADYSSSVAGGLGLTAEVGIVIGDRFTIMYRGEIASSVGSIIGTNGAFVDVSFGDHFALGVGAAFTLWSTLVYLGDNSYTQPFSGFTFPLRAHWNFGSRENGVAQRSGLTLSAHFAPGVSTVPSYERCFDCFYVGPSSSSAFAFTAGAGLGYLWW